MLSGGLRFTKLANIVLFSDALDFLEPGRYLTFRSVRERNDKTSYHSAEEVVVPSGTIYNIFIMV